MTDRQGARPENDSARRDSVAAFLRATGGQVTDANIDALLNGEASQPRNQVAVDRNQVLLDVLSQARARIPEEEVPEQLLAAETLLRTWAGPIRELSPTESDQALRGGLSAAFEATEFTVSHRPDRWGRWTVIRWTDGPTEYAVNRVASEFIGVGGYGQEGLIRYSDYAVMCDRIYSSSAEEWAARTWADAGVTRDPDEPDFTQGLPEPDSDGMMTIAGARIPIATDPSLEELTYRLLERTAF